MAKLIETILERLIFASRWLMAPFYLGLAGALAVLMVKFIQELFHIIPHALEMQEADVLLTLLTLVDLSMAGNLILMVIFAGYENFVSKIDTRGSADRPEWMGKVDFSGLKLKLIASIVAISGIHLLKVFMNVDQYSEHQMKWMLIIHCVFVGSGLMLAAMDWLIEHGHKLKHAMNNHHRLEH